MKALETSTAQHVSLMSTGWVLRLQILVNTKGFSFYWGFSQNKGWSLEKMIWRNKRLATITVLRTICYGMMSTKQKWTAQQYMNTNPQTMRDSEYERLFLELQGLNMITAMHSMLSYPCFQEFQATKPLCSDDMQFDNEANQTQKSQTKCCLVYTTLDTG